jgi:hypothetical protein
MMFLFHAGRNSTEASDRLRFFSPPVQGRLSDIRASEKLP